MKILYVVGTRPNFMKVAQVMKEIAQNTSEIEQLLIHTGQHYDENMSRVFFDELELPKPDVNLSVGSGTHAWQTAKIMMQFESIVLDYKPEWVVVVGDVNSTLACALVCAKLQIKVAHIEAGLRSFDRTMPEEYNRILTDQISDLLFTPSRDANENLLREGISPEKIHFVGNVMIDILVRLLPKAEKRWPRLHQQYRLDEYVLVTLHRPSNVDNYEVLLEILAALSEISQKYSVLFPVHPRTRQRINSSQLHSFISSIKLTEPLGYLDFLALQAHAKLVLTDSGGVQEETTFLDIPCLTVRPNTERPITITDGTNRLVENQRDALIAASHAYLNGESKRRKEIEKWDGLASQRIAQIIAKHD